MKRAFVALVYGFSAWIAAAFLVYAGSRAARGFPTALRCSALVAAFIPVFRLYFRRPDRLPPATAAFLSLGLIAALDYVLIAPYFAHPYDLFLSFRDWQLPALLVLASILAAGREAR